MKVFKIITVFLLFFGVLVPAFAKRRPFIGIKPPKNPNPSGGKGPTIYLNWFKKCSFRLKKVNKINYTVN